ncbi:MAG: response regulator [Candidatus Omnitrophica bacterium]|nr:response regulator [Candidatus Omnitrophota bacterium]MBU4478321.1 response regulator [Candidatus Omnitrophota bacterium]MCG2704249.1 response regulator [Candidatus Omnitrophota bacterium]
MGVKKKKILIVDDEASFTIMVKLNLEETGRFEVRTENKGLNALAAAKEFCPDLIFLDVIMPDMAGYEIAAQLGLDDATKNIARIFLTATVDQEDEGEKSRDGTALYVAKPITVGKLLKIIEQQFRG